MRQLPQLLRAAPKQGLDDLSDRELEVMRLCAEDLSNREISQRLFLSEGTVRNYISALLQKLNLRDRTQLVVHYYRGAKE